MGSSGSKPRVVQIDNPNHKNEPISPDIQVTIDVAKRIAEARNKNESKISQKSLEEIEKLEFEKTKEQMKYIYDKGLEMPKEFTQKANEMRQNISNCYKANKGELLLCNPLVLEFQSYVHKTKLKYLLAIKQELERRREQELRVSQSIQRPPGKCGAIKGSAGESNRPTGIKVGGDCRDPADLSHVSNDWQNK